MAFGGMNKGDTKLFRGQATSVGGGHGRAGGGSILQRPRCSGPDSSSFRSGDGEPNMSETQHEKADCCLVNMPYAHPGGPSLGLGILQAVLESEGFSVVTIYGNVLFLERIGLNEYEFATTAVNWLGEWTFSHIAFPDFNPDQEQFIAKVQCQVDQFTRRFKRENIPNLMFQIREEATAFVDYLAGRIMDLGPLMVGCTSTFQAHVPALALLRRIRELAPEIVTMMGGANCKGIMGLTTHRKFAWVDYLVSGDADELIIALARLITEYGRDIDPKLLPHGVFGPAHRKRGYPGSSENVPTSVVASLAKIPPPNYEDYFVALEEAPLLNEALSPGLVLESSRGCWWARRAPCSFCGLHSGETEYRTKATEQTLEELRILYQRHGVHRIEFVDNILSPNWFTGLLPRLGEIGRPYSIFVETVSNLNPRQLKKLQEGGVTFVQTGIESLDGHVLKLLNKGAKSWQNIRFLKGCLHYGINAIWIFLHSVPGEDKSWYRKTTDMLPLLFHLQPPVYLNRIMFIRFSEYHRCPEHYGLELQPNPAYRYIYPLPQEDLANLVCDFHDAHRQAIDFDDSDGGGAQTEVKDLLSAVFLWNTVFHSKDRPVLEMTDTGTDILIRDTREVAVRPCHRFTGYDREIHLTCEEGIRRDLLYRSFQERGMTIPEIERVVTRLVDMKLLLLLDGHYVTLAVRKPVAALKDDSAFPGGRVDRLLYAALRRIGKTQGAF